MSQSKNKIVLLLGAVVVILLLGSIFTLDQRSNALILQFGEPVRTVTEPGLHFKMPLIQNIVMFDKRIQNLYSDTSEVIALDQKTMRVDAYIKYRIADVLKFYQAAQNEAKFKMRLSTILDSSLRQVLGSIPFKALLSEERSGIMRKIRDIVHKEAQGFGVDIYDVRISRADLPDKSREAVYRRMRTDREKEAREIRANGTAEAQKITAIADKDRIAVLAEAQKTSAKIKADGDGEALRIFASAIAPDPEFFEFYRTLELYKNTMNKDNTIFILSPEHKILKYMGQ